MQRLTIPARRPGRPISPIRRSPGTTFQSTYFDLKGCGWASVRIAVRGNWPPHDRTAYLPTLRYTARKMTTVPRYERSHCQRPPSHSAATAKDKDNPDNCSPQPRITWHSRHVASRPQRMQPEAEYRQSLLPRCSSLATTGDFITRPAPPPRMEAKEARSPCLQVCLPLIISHSVNSLA